MKAGTYKEGKYTVRKYSYGTTIWYFNGKKHREDGPAIESESGEKAWYIKGKLHREDGPAKTWEDGDKEWWLNEKEYSEVGWKKEIRKRKLKALGL